MEPIRTGCLELIERRMVDRPEEGLRAVEGPRVEHQLGCMERAFSTSARVRGQRGSPFKERRGGGQAAARLGPRSGSLEFERHLLIRLDGCLRPMPGAPI